MRKCFFSLYVSRITSQQRLLTLPTQLFSFGNPGSLPPKDGLLAAP
jgi:hypothetical protein